MTDNTLDDRPVYHAACHCGTVRFTLQLADGLRTARRCNCSYCRMRGAVVVSANLDDIRILQGQEALTLYQFNTGGPGQQACASPPLVCGIALFAVIIHGKRLASRIRGDTVPLLIHVAHDMGMMPADMCHIR